MAEADSSALGRRPRYHGVPHVVIRRTARLIVVAVLALSGVVSAQTPSTAKPAVDVKRDSEKFEKSLTGILIRGLAPKNSKPAAPFRTTFTDQELNAWLAQGGKDNVPVGLLNPVVAFTGPGTLTVRGVVDLDAVRKSRERGWMDPFAYLNGMMPIVLNGTLSGAGGQGTFDVESATLGTVSVPKILLQELISYYSKSTEFPDGISLAKPFPLPAGVRELAIARGAATVVQ